MYPKQLTTRTTTNVLRTYFGRRYYSTRRTSTFPRLDIGVRIGWFTRYVKKNITIVSRDQFTALRPASLLWGRTMPGFVEPELTTSQILESLSLTIQTLDDSNTNEHTVATIDDDGHAYVTALLAGVVDEDMAGILSPSSGWRAMNELIGGFAPWGYHDLPEARQPVLAYQLGIDGNFERTWPADASELVEYRRTIDADKAFDGQVKLGTNTISRSHFRSGEDERFRFWQYLASTFRFEHGLDGYATHTLVLDKVRMRLYFVATGEGKHVLRTVDAFNNPIAPFVFSVMVRSYYRWLEMQAARKKAGKDRLDLIVGDVDAQRELRRYISLNDPGLRRDRRRAHVLDFLGRWLPMVRFIFGADVIGAPRSGSGSGSGTGSGDGDGGYQGSLWPFLLFVAFLDEDDPDETDADEDELDSMFVQLGTSDSEI
jgi:hypothetical protein